MTGAIKTGKHCRSKYNAVRSSFLSCFVERRSDQMITTAQGCVQCYHLLPIALR
jgi:hypothetical protein